MFQAYLQTIFPLSISIFFFQKKKEKGFSLLSGLSCFRLFFFFFIFYFLFSQKSYSQDSIKRPKIGLVLTGGGAKGFAHIGVLKVLEKAGIKIDYIGGTSMGAVVGGLYATGYNATQIDSIFHNTNFDELLQDYIPRTSKSFYEKRNDELYAMSLPFNNFSVGVPIALSKGMYNYNLLTKLTHSVRHIRDFDKLPIPFVCIATNIETGEQLVIRSGYLPQALLASSAFPTLFSPVEIDGKLLIDGGVTNNYPIDEVKKMGADIIIGVDVQDGLKDRNSLKEATRILVQISNLEMIEDMKQKVKKTDIYIKPDITDFSVISFDKGKEIIKKGEEAAMLVFNDLKKLAVKNNEYEINNLKCKADSIQIDRISINDVKNYTRAYVIGKLGFKQGSKISYDQLKKGINALNTTGNFSSLSYQINDLKPGDELNLILTESKNKTFLKFGLHYDGLYKSAALINITQKKSIFRNDVISLDLGLGDNFRYNLDYYIDNGFYFSFGFKSRFNQFNRNITTDFNNGALFSQFNINSINVDYSDLTNQAYLQTIFAQKFLLGGGVELKHLKIKSKTLQNTNPIFENSDYASAFGYIKYDSFDNKYFPKKGWFFNGDIQTYLYSTNYTNNFSRFSILKGEFGITRTFYKVINLKFQSEAGLSFGQDSVHFLDFVLGGYGFNTVNNFKPFYGYDFVSVASDSYIKSLATLDIEFYKKNHFNFSANIANAEDKLFSSGNWLATPKYTGYAVGYGLETVLGPLEIKYSWSPELPKGFFWFNIGFWF
ncbi:patatin-like phospholipase family protein [Flavobacterium sp. SUN052]|uniref:patatin-like phospholipase family protein n=1 Tax=Flavobacterium sp. SUN052 TaxID=3002441 RepID=UPI00237DE0CF|nr:patatin-like phospholipase family protein [Flavobacterium sp. SUN052]MEC4004264.1 patatin-like phospholipase family protein [Flavobacterium sp. SUN052]